jgi:hypothetical protein
MDGLTFIYDDRKNKSEPLGYRTAERCEVYVLTPAGSLTLIDAYSKPIVKENAQRNVISDKNYYTYYIPINRE